MNETIKTILSRRSVRKYKPDAIPEEHLMTILECGRQAQCGSNRQSWKIICVTDPQVRTMIADVCPTGQFIRQSYACIAVMIGPESTTRMEDASSATVNMILAAQSLGLGACWIASDKRAHSKKVENILAVPEGWEIQTLFALGVPDEKPTREKKEFSQVVSFNKF